MLSSFTARWENPQGPEQGHRDPTWQTRARSRLGRRRMRRLHVGVAALALFAYMVAGEAALAQKSGGTLKISHFDSPASMSLLEEATAATLRPIMGVFNNLVMYKQDVAQNSPETIVPDLATSWSWSDDGMELTFPLRRDVKWHDGKPFTARDVKCTWELL